MIPRTENQLKTQTTCHWRVTCSCHERHSPSPATFQQGKQHLGPADEAALGPVSVKHVPQQLLHAILPVTHAQSPPGDSRTWPAGPPLLPGAQRHPPPPEAPGDPSP